MIIYPPFMDSCEPVQTPLWFFDDEGHEYQAKGYRVTPEYMIKNIARPHPMWERLVGKISEKNQDRVLVPELEEQEPVGETVRDLSFCYLGNKSVYAVNRKRKDVRYMPPSWGGISVSELGRTYLYDCHDQAEDKPLRNRREYNRYCDIKSTWWYPGGRHRGEYAYVDISQAYWSILKHSTMDLWFEPGKYLSQHFVPFRDIEEVTDFRGLRHVIPGSLHIRETQVSRKGQIELRAIKSSLWYPATYGYTMHVMNAVAREVIDNFGAMMVLSDAYIVPVEMAQLVVEFLQERWGLTGVVKGSGSGALYGQNCYRLPGKASADAPVRWTTAKKWTYITESGTEMVKIADEKPFSTLIPVEHAWLQHEHEVARRTSS